MTIEPMLADSAAALNAFLIALAGLLIAGTQLLTSWLADRKRDKVRDDLIKSNDQTARKLDDMSKTGEAVHTLVNSNMGVQLKISAVALRRIADLTKHPDDISAAELAEKLYLQHEEKQSVVDNNKTKGIP